MKIKNIYIFYENKNNKMIPSLLPKSLKSPSSTTGTCPKGWKRKHADNYINNSSNKELYVL